jgi:23S rRNA (cytosine1962-C5)-methyltransferase
MNYKILVTKPGRDYELLDSGDGEKLERYGEVVISRPDPQSLWQKRLAASEWQKAQAYFKRDAKSAEWSKRGEVPERWLIEFGGLKMWIKLSAFKHTGLFPEHEQNWEWVREKVLSRVSEKQPVTVLNLFGYTGGVSLAAAQAGASVVHVDGSKVAINWARDNASSSGLGQKPIRWILDDAAAFVRREIKRGHTYEAIIMDPPAFGHGPKRELWKIEDHFLPLLEDCKKILSPKPLFFIVNGYASGYSAVAYKNSLGDLLKQYNGEIEIGELTIGEKGSERLLPAGIFARWSAV